MFEGSEWIPAERTVHTAIPPASVRIQHFQRKGMPSVDKVV